MPLLTALGFIPLSIHSITAPINYDLTDDGIKAIADKYPSVTIHKHYGHF